MEEEKSLSHSHSKSELHFCTFFIIKLYIPFVIYMGSPNSDFFSSISSIHPPTTKHPKPNHPISEILTFLRKYKNPHQKSPSPCRKESKRARPIKNKALPGPHSVLSPFQDFCITSVISKDRSRRRQSRTS